MSEFDDIFEAAQSGAPQDVQRLSTEEYAAKKKAEREAVYELADNTAMEIAEDCQKFQQYLDVQTQFGRYSAVNALLILAQKPESTKLGDFDYWKSQGAYVNKGQSGISILEPGKEYQREDGSVGVSYNVKKVFDVSQVDARKIKTAPAPNFTERQLLQALISKAPAKINGVAELPQDLPVDMRRENGAATDPETGEIYVRKGMEFRDTFSAVALELCYAEAVNDISDAAVPRFTAYCAAYMLCKKYGVDTQGFAFEDAPGTFDMISDLNPQIMKHELSKIRDAADSVSGRMARQLDAVARAAEPGSLPNPPDSAGWKQSAKAAEKPARSRNEAR